METSVTASAQVSALPAPTELRQSPADVLRRHSEEMRQDAAHALESLAARMEALAAEAVDLAGISNVFSPKVIDGLKQYANNSRGSAAIIRSTR